jgi:hypothetical protein
VVLVQITIVPAAIWTVLGEKQNPDPVPQLGEAIIETGVESEAALTG